MTLNLEDGDKIDDMFLFADVAAVKLEKGGFKFFPHPLVAGKPVNEIDNIGMVNPDGPEGDG